MALTTEVRTITPQEAAEMLGKNKNNRNIRKSRVQTYARDMAAGKWKLNGDPIRFNGSNKLVDGQHRLQACVLADKPFKTVVITGVTDDAHPTMDTGITRTIGDELRYAGETQTVALGTVLGLIWKYDRDSFRDPWANPSRADLIGVLKAQPTIRDSMKSLKVGRDTGVRGTSLCAVVHLISREHGQDVADAFLEHLQKGLGYVDGDPCLALRNYALNLNSSRMLRPNTTEWMAVVIKSANAWLSGRPVKNVRWRRVGPGAEQFPRLFTAEEITTGQESE